MSNLLNLKLLDSMIIRDKDIIFDNEIGNISQTRNSSIYNGDMNIGNKIKSFSIEKKNRY